MKVLIWIGCLLIATILNTLLGYATGIKAGYLVFYFVVYFVAKRLCDKWDEHKANKTNSTHTHRSTTNQTDSNPVRFCRKCGEKLINTSKFCRKCGTEIVEEY